MYRPLKGHRRICNMNNRLIVQEPFTSIIFISQSKFIDNSAHLPNYTEWKSGFSRGNFSKNSILCK